MKLLFIFLLIAHISFGQELKVDFARRAYHANGVKIKKGNELSRKEQVLIKEEGQLNIRYKERWTIIVKPGKYIIDSLVKSESDKPDFMINDSIHNILEAKGLNDCNFKYQQEQAGVHAHRNIDNIEINIPGNVLTGEDTLTIRWKNPSPYRGEYYVVLTNMFDDYVGLEKTASEELVLNLKRYKKHVAVLYKITAEDCRESETYIIRIE